MPMFRGLRQTLRGGNTGSSRLDDAHGVFPDHPYNHILPASALPADMQEMVANPMRSAPPRPTPRLTIGGSGGESVAPNAVPDTRAARKANSPKAKARALKEINKNPLTPLSNPAEDYFGRTFEESPQAWDYRRAKTAESDLANGYPLVPGLTKESEDNRRKDIVGSYIATGKNEATPEGQAWMGKHGSRVKRDMYG